jgi:hypothetical protein
LCCVGIGRPEQQGPGNQGGGAHSLASKASNTNAITVTSRRPVDKTPPLMISARDAAENNRKKMSTADLPLWIQTDAEVCRSSSCGFQAG